MPVQEARQHLVHLAAELLACRAEAISVQNGLAFNRHQPEEQLTLAQLVAAASRKAHDTQGEGGWFTTARTPCRRRRCLLAPMLWSWR